MKRIGLSLALGVGAFLAGCSFTSGFGHNLPGTVGYEFNVYNAEETQSIRAKAGETIHLTYAAECASGELVLRLVDPQDETVWELAVEGDTENGSEDIVAENGGASVWKSPVKMLPTAAMT